MSGEHASIHALKGLRNRYQMAQNIPMGHAMIRRIRSHSSDQQKPAALIPAADYTRSHWKRQELAELIALGEVEIFPGKYIQG